MSTLPIPSVPMLEYAPLGGVGQRTLSWHARHPTPGSGGPDGWWPPVGYAGVREYHDIQGRSSKQKENPYADENVGARRAGGADGGDAGAGPSAAGGVE